MEAQTIPSSRTVDWSHAGHEGPVPNPVTVIDVTTFGAIGDGISDNYQFIVNAISSLNGNAGVIYFPAGNFLISSTLSLPDSIVLRGASSDSAHLIFDFAGVVGNCINVAGSANFSFVNVISGYTKGSYSIVVDDVSNFSADDYAEIREDNGSWDTQPASWADYSVGQIIHVTSVSGDTIFFNQPLRTDYDSALNIQVRKFIPAKEVGIECLNIYRRDNVSSGVCMNIYFDYAANCWVRGVESSLSIGSHIEADASSHIEITGCYVHHANAYDGISTHGYGITLFMHTGDSKVENNIMRHLRHSFSMQCGANGNVIGYNYSIDPNRSEVPANFGADISMHGHYTFENLFEGNIVQNIQIDQTWGPTGPHNTYFRNRVELYGIVMTSGTVNSDSENFVGNEIPNMGTFMGLYVLAGMGHFEYGNNVRAVITPAGTTSLSDTSYYLHSIPSFWNIGGTFPSIGEPNVSGIGSNPAKERYLSGSNFTVCSDQLVTAIDENSFSDFIIFPNPVSCEFKVQSSGFKGKKIMVKICNYIGELVYAKQFSNSISSEEITIDISVLKKGLYILKLSDGGNFFTAKKILKE